MTADPDELDPPFRDQPPDEPDGRAQVVGRRLHGQ
jgi:hypothetical protein